MSQAPTGSTTRTRLTAAERRHRIVTAARQEFARIGFHGASTARIASIAGCSEPMLYKHFPSKLRLFADTLAASEAEIATISARVATTTTVSFTAWKQFLTNLMADPAYAELTALRKLAIAHADDPEIREVLRAGTDLLLDRARQAIEIGKQQGLVRESVDAEYAAWMWLGITFVACYRERVDGPGGFVGMTPHAETFFMGLLVDDAFGPAPPGAPADP